MTQLQHPGSGQAQSTERSRTRGRLYPTQTYLSEEVRIPIIELLNRTLADATVLMTQTKYAHWNVKGMEFYGLHQLFDEIAETVEGHIDLVAERVTALGGEALGTAGMAVSNCRLPSMPTDATTGAEYVEILANALAIHDANLSEAIETAQQYGDEDTADLLNEISREVSQHLWFLESHLQTEPRSGTTAGGGTGAQSTGGHQRSMQSQSGGHQPPAGGQMGGQRSSMSQSDRGF